MRNLLWTATAVVVMLVGGSNVLAQATTVVPTNVAGGNPPNGQIFVKATGAYTVPAMKVADHVDVEVYVGSVVKGQQTWSLVATLNDANPAGGAYNTSQHALTIGTQYMFIAHLWVTPQGGGAPTKVTPGVVALHTP